MKHGRQTVTVPLDLSPPEPRPVKKVFFTDEGTAAWLDEMFAQRDQSLIIHRIVKAAKEAAMAPVVGEDKRTGEDRRKTA
jgi:hypothetical protein